MPTGTSGTSDGGAGRFNTTRWTVILEAGNAASPNHERARNQFCETYWYPVYAFVRRKGHSPEEAEDLTQDFFFWLLQKNKLARLTRKGARFRSFLRKVLKRFLANAWKRKQAQKRGGAKMILSLDDSAEKRYQSILADHRTPEALFDRQWSLSLQDHVMAALRDEYRRDGKQQEFECLQGFFPGTLEQLSYAEAAQVLGLTVEAVRMAVHRLRRHWKKLLRAEVAAPGTRAEEIDEEIRYLFAVTSGE